MLGKGPKKYIKKWSLITTGGGGGLVRTTPLLQKKTLQNLNIYLSSIILCIISPQYKSHLSILNNA